MAGQRKSVRGNRARIFEHLENRRSFSLVAPTDITFSIATRVDPGGETTIATVKWTDTNSDETGYLVEYSADGISDFHQLYDGSDPYWPAGDGGTLSASTSLVGGVRI